MYHFAPRSWQDSLLWVDWVEGAALWSRLLRHVPGSVALCVMGTHVHVLHPRNVSRELGRAMGAYAQWRCHRRGERGPVWGRTVAPTRVTPDKVFRNVRYIALNPCRARLVDDPLGWPFSSHRDAVGLAVPAMRPRAADPAAHHRQVSADPSVHVEGSSLPYGHGAPSLDAVFDATSAITRTPLEALPHTLAPRRLFVCAARALTRATVAEIADAARVDRRTVQRCAARTEPAIDVIARVAGDARFSALTGPVPGLAARGSAPPRRHRP